MGQRNHNFFWSHTHKLIADRHIQHSRSGAYDDSRSVSDSSTFFNIRIFFHSNFISRHINSPSRENVCCTLMRGSLPFFWFLHSAWKISLSPFTSFIHNQELTTTAWGFTCSTPFDISDPFTGRQDRRVYRHAVLNAFRHLRSIHAKPCTSGKSS